jgi:D-3-phosphoglycerate dehydrogenase
MYKVIAATKFADETLITIAKEMLKEQGEVTLDVCSSEEELIRKCSDADAVIAVHEPFTDKVLTALPKLKLISSLGIGFNSIDTEAAKKHGIAVCNNPFYCVNEVADHTVILALMLNRRIFEFNKEIKVDRVWSPTSQKGKIRRISTQTFGLVGFGNIARRVAKRMQGFGCTVIAYDPYIKQDFADQFDVEMVELDEIYNRADMISLHVPLNPATDKMINQEAFNKMAVKKPIFVNCGRGGLVDEDALYDALVTGKIAGAGLDVLVSEKPDLTGEYARFANMGANVVLTPHAAYYSEDANYDMKTMCLQHIIDFFDGNGDKVPVVNGVRTPRA